MPPSMCAQGGRGTWGTGDLGAESGDSKWQCHCVRSVHTPELWLYMEPTLPKIEIINIFENFCGDAAITGSHISFFKT